MLRETKTWDIRCPGSLFALKKKLGEMNRRSSYRWHVDALIAKQICDILARAYRVKSCKVKPGRGRLFKGLEVAYSAPIRTGDRPTMFVVKKKPHMKAVFHEFYHHLDWVTDHAYDSTNGKGAPDYGAQFAERLWNVLTAEYRPLPMKVKVHGDGRGIYIEQPLQSDKRLRPLGRSRVYHPGTYVHAEFKRVPASSDFTATVVPWSLFEQGAAAVPDVWSSVQSQIAAAKPPPPRKKVKVVPETAAQRKRRLKATRLLAAGIEPDPRALGITCSEEGCERGARVKYIDELWRCGAHHKRRVKFVKNHFKTEVAVTREKLAKLDVLIAKLKEFERRAASGKVEANTGWAELGKMVKEGERLGCNMDDVTRGAERTLKKMEEVMTKTNAKSEKQAKTAKPAKSTLKDVAAGIKAGTKKAVKKVSNGWRNLELKDNAKITIKVKECPYSGARAKRWVYKTGMTVAAAVEKGVSRSDIKWDVAHEYIAVR